MTDRVDRQSFASEATRATFITRQDARNVSRIWKMHWGASQQ